MSQAALVSSPAFTDWRIPVVIHGWVVFWQRVLSLGGIGKDELVAWQSMPS